MMVRQPERQGEASQSGHRQHGAALITAILITAIATIAAVAMASRQHLDIRRTTNVIESSQAYLFALGAEEWARQLLIRDGKDNQVDHLEEEWATSLPPIEVEGGRVAGQIEDLQGRFNLNNLVKDKKPSQIDVERFRRLLRQLALDEELVYATIDWIDENEDVSIPGGAEDFEYLGNDLPYRTPNAMMASVSELLLIKGVDRRSYDALLPYVTVLPEPTDINVNTASAELLMTLLDDLTQAEADQLIDDRGENGYQTVEDFLNHEALDGRISDKSGLGVVSKYFIINAAAEVGRGRTNLYSLMVRDKNAKVEVVMRAQGVY